MGQGSSGHHTLSIKTMSNLRKCTLATVLGALLNSIGNPITYQLPVRRFVLPALVCVASMAAGHAEVTVAYSLLLYNSDLDCYVCVNKGAIILGSS